MSPREAAIIAAMAVRDWDLQAAARIYADACEVANAAFAASIADIDIEYPEEADHDGR